MSEENNNENIQQENQAQEEMFTKGQVQDMIDNEVFGLKSKVNELLSEKKAIAERAKEDEVKQRGDLEEIKAFYEQRDKDREKEQQEWRQSLLDEKNNSKKLNIINGLVGDYVDGEAAAFMLKNMVEVKEGSEIYRDFAGNVVADNAADFKKWAGNNPHMSHLLRGNQATGGGANGNTNKSSGAAGVQEMTRAEFNQLSLDQQREVALDARKGKYKII
jgi:hypothetical protein